MNKKRLDQLIIDLYPQLSRSKAQTLIEKGKVQVLQGGWVTVTKASAKFDADDLGVETIQLLDDEELQYVSRGALKLKAAIVGAKIEVADKTCLDVGLSTGGFSDYLLKEGARKVLGVDVGREQLHPSLKESPRLMFRDKVNARYSLPEDLLDSFFKGDPALFDLIAVDVSFISLDKIVPSIVHYLAPAGELVVLVKPQFELQKKDLNKQGVVKTNELCQQAVEKIIEVLQQNKLQLEHLCESPIEGENGNKEVLIVSRWSDIHP